MINMQDNDFLQPGDVVTLNKSITNKPVMYIVSKEHGGSPLVFIGFKCRWFTDNGFIQEAVFSTKDLIKI